MFIVSKQYQKGNQNFGVTKKKKKKKTMAHDEQKKKNTSDVAKISQRPTQLK